MIDPMVSLAFSVYSNKGAYALLLGSGISRASGIPTGWEVVIDLIRKVASMERENCEPDPVAWFRQKHSTEPDYSKLLDVIAKTQAERQQLLRKYFEPSEDERAQGLKAPSAAHKAIARLAATGHLKIILTTNFDRLMEKALEEIDVTPTIISTADQLSGALPLAHSGITIIKLHGDYLDTRIRNTETELAAYHPAFDKLLDRIFDEYGLIICGWSADWDIALRMAIERCPTRRFTTYWSTRSPLSGHAKRLAEHRRAETLNIRDANQLFEKLEEKVRALDDLAAPYPLSAKIAVATVKRYLVDPASKIRLRDLVYEETERLVAELTESAFSAQTSLEHPAELQQRIAKYNALCETVLSILVTGCHWGGSDQTCLWVNCLQRIANSGQNTSGLTYLINLRRYPALLLSYGAGIAAVAAGNYETLATILVRATAKNDSGEKKSFCLQIYPVLVMADAIGRWLPGTTATRTPVSDYLHNTLRVPLRDFIPSDEDYELQFDRFEYLLALAHADSGHYETHGGGWYGPFGRFAWRGRLFEGDRIIDVIRKEIEAEGSSWAPVKAGLFGGSSDRAKAALMRFHKFLDQIQFS